MLWSHWMVACMMVEILGYKWPSMGDQSRTEATEAGLEEDAAVHDLGTDAVVAVEEGVVALDPGLVLGPDLEVTGDVGNDLVQLPVTGHPATGLLVEVVVVGLPKIDHLVVKDQEAEALSTRNRVQNLGVEAVVAEARAIQGVR